MTSETLQIAERIKALPEPELDALMDWLAEWSAEADQDEWDAQIERDAKPGGRLEALAARARADIAAGRTRPLDEVLGDS